MASLQRKPLLPGKDYLDQLKLIIRTLGTPGDEELTFITSQRARAYVKARFLPPCPARALALPNPLDPALALALQGLPYQPPPNMAEMFPGASPLALDLLGKLLQFDPRRRIGVQEALQHPYLAQLYGGEAAEPSAPGPFSFDFSEENLTEQMVRDLVWDEICFYHPEGAAGRGK